MNDTTTLALNGNQEHAKQREALSERLLRATAGLFDIFTIYMGHVLGLYAELDGSGYVTSTELAGLAGTHERYTREWLEQQTVAGIVEVEDDTAEASARRFRLPSGYREVLVEREEPWTTWRRLPRSRWAPSTRSMLCWRHFAAAGACRTGRTAQIYGQGQAGMNRNLFLYELGQKYLRAVPDLHRRLLADPPARVATSAAASAGPALGWPWLIPTCRSTALISIRRRSRRHGPTPTPMDWATG